MRYYEDVADKCNHVYGPSGPDLTLFMYLISPAAEIINILKLLIHVTQALGWIGSDALVASGFGKWPPQKQDAPSAGRNQRQLQVNSRRVFAHISLLRMCLSCIFRSILYRTSTVKYSSHRIIFALMILVWNFENYILILLLKLKLGEARLNCFKTISIMLLHEDSITTMFTKNYFSLVLSPLHLNYLLSYFSITYIVLCSKIM